MYTDLMEKRDQLIAARRELMELRKGSDTALAKVGGLLLDVNKQMTDLYERLALVVANDERHARFISQFPEMGGTVRVVGKSADDPNATGSLPSVEALLAAAEARRRQGL